ncbi:hypothetical protein BGI41_01280 [Methanobrevibacter sp. 87.7]|uniref:hypothetical protein n=1 Tax=Methanobrevibacter sp. 87.7 TaxID=387957 RepID=UPI000B50BFA6|nr:hypothetical protein [Methanobrevibacter sp. 87.7]OWT33654.1 hypothetical protein BGI41_01280 [Methanobrevibacter sp. 87.7]
MDYRKIIFIIVFCTIVLSIYLIITGLQEDDSLKYTVTVDNSNFTVPSTYKVVNNSSNYAILTTDNQSANSSNCYHLLIQRINESQKEEFSNNVTADYYSYSVNKVNNTYMVNKSYLDDIIEYITFCQNGNKMYILDLCVNSGYYKSNPTNRTIPEQLNDIINDSGYKPI